MARIIYISTREQRPTGGIKVIFQHVQALREMGFDAAVGHPIKGFRPQWLEVEVPIVFYLKDFKVYPDDIFVIPETGYNTLRLLKNFPVRKVMFCQNWFGIAQGLGDARHWREFGIDSVLACSGVVADCVRETFDFDRVAAITCPIDHRRFSPQPKQRQIAFMPRKRQDDIRLIQKYFQLLAPRSDFRWLAIDNASERDVARDLGESAIFLSLSRREGLGLPPLEAMASGCLVTGFRGIGGREYATAANGLWCEEEDLFDCARQLKTACELIDSNGAGGITARGLETAGEFTFQKMKEDLQAFWQSH